MEVIVEESAVDALVQHLRAPTSEEEDGTVACEHEVEKDAAFALGLLAVKVSIGIKMQHFQLHFCQK